MHPSIGLKNIFVLICWSPVRFSPKGFQMKLVQTRTSPRIYVPRSGKI